MNSLVQASGPARIGWADRFRIRRFLTPMALILLWQLGSTTGIIPPRTLAAPATVIVSFGRLLGSGESEHHLLVSLGRVASGLGIAIFLGVSLALAAGLSRRGEDLVDTTMQMLRTMPFLALVPLFILWFGIGETPKVALVALGGTFPIYLTLFGAIRGVDPKLIEAAETLGLNRAELIAHVVLPSALPGALVGLRYSLGAAWLSLVVAEQINADSGLGFLIMNARDFLQTDVIVVALIVYALLGLGADQIVRLIERHALAWRPSLIRS
jgi:sulfonate transport system permease protein